MIEEKGQNKFYKEKLNIDPINHKIGEGQIKNVSEKGKAEKTWNDSVREV